MGEVVRIEALGAQIDVLALDEAAHRLRQQWSRCMRPPSQARAGASAEARPVPNRDLDPDLTVDLTGTLADEPPDVTDYRITTRVTRAAIAAQSGLQLLLHAAALADPVTARALVLVAESGTGKTTAAAHLGQRLGYLTDETVAVDHEGAITAYPKPLSTVIDPARPHDKSQHSPDELGLLPAPQGPTAALLVLLERDPAHVEAPTLEPVPLIDALIALIPQTSALPELDRPLHRVLDLITRTGGVRRLRYREIATTDDLLGAALAAATPTEQQVRAHPPSTRPARLYDEVAPRTPSDLRPDERLHRGPYVDAVQIGDEVIVLVGATPVRLTGLGATIWLAGAAPQTLPAVVAACQDEHGDHADAAELVADAVQALRAYGLLVAAT